MSEQIKFHPLADIFPLMEGAEFDELVADIKAHGLRDPICMYEGQIVDGRNRYRALQRIEGSPEGNPNHFRVMTLKTDKAVKNYIISKNIHRRHLKAEDRQKFLVELVKTSPEKSDRQLAKEAGTTHPTIAKARKQAEATGKALPVEKRTGADGKARKQPAKRGREAREAREKARKEADENAAVAHILAIVDGMTRWHPSHRAALFIALWDKFRDELIAVQPDTSVVAPIENAPPPDVGADNMREQIAALDDGADLGPMPESLRRAP
jgi:ParB-like chromosome segregation protein Spo0J